MNPQPMSYMSPPSPPMTGSQIVATDGRILPLRATSIEAHASGGIARVVLKQRFVNPHDEPLAVRYQVPLPSDGAVSGFAFQLGDRRVVGEIDTRQQARARFESAIVEGRSAALLEQDRSSLFTQDIGNIPPRSEITAEIAIDQKLHWLAQGAWEWRFPTVVAPRFSGVPGRVADADRIDVVVSADGLDARTSVTIDVDDTLFGRPESPSHGLAAEPHRGGTRIMLARDARLDRDLVVRWPVADRAERVDVTVARPGRDHHHANSAFGVVTIVPPTVVTEDISRDLILLIDTSGSMHGEPLAQARRVCSALIESLTADDQLEMIEFSWKASRWKRRAVPATDKNKKAARKWLGRLEANGGTQMREGILDALASLRPHAQRQVILISDGLIGFESEIVWTVDRRLPRGSRVHTVGVGSAVNRSLTGPVARAGRGVEAIIGIGEDAERAAQRLVAHTRAPVLVDVRIEGEALRNVAPTHIPDLLAGSPTLAFVELDPAGGTLTIVGETVDGPWSQAVDVRPVAGGAGHPALASMFARERVADLEVRRAAGDTVAPLDADIERLGLQFQIATRKTSWVAVSDAVTVDPTAPSRHEDVPHELPHGMSVQMLGLRPPVPTMPMQAQLAVAMGGVPAMVRSPSPPGYAGGPPAVDGAPPPGFGAPPRGAPPAAPAPPPPGSGAPPAAGSPPPPVRATSAPPRDDDAFSEELSDDEVSASARPPALAQAERPARAKESRGLGRRIADKLRDVFGSAIRGTVVVFEEERLVVRIDVPSAFRWEPLGAVLLLADGTELPVTIDQKRTTQPGEVSPGQVLRVALRWSDGEVGAKPRSIRLSTPNGDLSIRL